MALRPRPSKRPASILFGPLAGAVIRLFPMLALLPGTSHADWALARLVDDFAGRTYLTRSIEGSAFARRILGTFIASQADYDRLLGRIIRDEIPASDVYRLRADLYSLSGRLRTAEYQHPGVDRGQLTRLVEMPGGLLPSPADFLPGGRLDTTLEANRRFIAEFTEATIRHYGLTPAGGGSPSIAVTRYTPADAQANALANQNVYRDLSEYLLALDPEFGRVLAAGRDRGADFHWVDSGGGAGTALVEAYAGSLWNARDVDSWRMDAISEFDILRDWFEMPIDGDFYQPPARAALKDRVVHDFRGTVVTFENVLGTLENMSRAERALLGHLNQERLPRVEGHLALTRELRTSPQSAHFRYLSGRLLQEIPLGELGRADLITDFFGPYAYAEDKFAILARYARLLKSGGEAHVVTQLEAVVRIPGRNEEVPLEAFLMSPESGLADAFSRGTSPVQRGGARSIILRPKNDTAAKLETLSARLRAIRVGTPEDLNPGARVSYPPKFRLDLE